MKKRITSLLLAAIMLLQIIIPQNIFAEEDKNLPQDKYVKVGMIDAKSYDAKIMNELNRIASRNRTSRSRGPGVRLFSRGPYFGDNNEPKDKDKPKYFGNVSAKLDLKGLDGNAFQWNEIFGVDENGNPKPAQIIFRQMDEESSTDTGLYYMLQITKEGKYTWSDGAGNPTKLPLFSKGFKPYRYEVRIDERVSDKVKLLTEVIFGTEGSSPTFSPENSDGEIIANITLGLTYQQIASTKFKSEWHTGVAESNRPGMKANFAFDDGGDGVSPVSVELPKNDKDTKIIRDWLNNFDPDLVMSIYLEKTPDVKIDKTTNGLTFKDEDGAKTVKSDDHKFKYDFTYDVINGGKLTMTEVIPVTFDANGGKFASITEQNAEQKIVKEVDYDGTLSDKAETPTKPGKAFKGWATDAKGTTPAADDEYKNLKAAKTFYAIWSDEDIQAEELKTTESLGSFPKKGPSFTNDFVPTFEDLKAKVKVKNSDGDFGPLPTTGVTFSIVDGTKEYTENSNDLKKFIYEKVKENDKDEVSRTETVKAKIKYDDGTTREIEIPIKVLKNIYKGSDQGNKLPHIPDDYVKVTIDPTNKAQNPDKTYYYVNPKAKVVVPGKDPVGAGDNKFTKWTIKADGETVEKDYEFGKRQIYDKDHTITAQYGTGTIKIAYVDQNGKEIDDKYQIAKQDYPSEKSGGLGRDANDADFVSTGPKFKGYVFNIRNSIKGKHYKDSKGPDKLDTVTYKYYKKVTRKDPNDEDAYFKVVFDANGGKFEKDTQKTLWVYMYTDDNPVTFEEARAEIEGEYGLPTKKMAAFKEWQDKKDKGTKVGDSREIKFPGWNNGEYTPEVFYAHYGEASAKIKYIDLDGKPIADVYKLDDQKYPTEKTGEPGNKIESAVYTAETAPKFTGYKFNRIELNPKDGKYSLDKNTTIKIYYEKVPDVIPAKPDGSNPDSVPADYVRVEFVPTDKGSIDGDKIFFVNPKKEVTIPVNNPKANATYTFKEWKMGADAKGEVYTPGTPKKFTQDTTITATYEETENIIPYDPSVPDPMVRPDGYVRVTFVADTGLKLKEQKAYYVKANAKDTAGKSLTLGNADLVKPKYSEDTGYKFEKWDKKDDLEIKDADIVVTAKAKKLDNVIPEKTGETPNTKPDGYKEVTFVVKTVDEAKGSIEGVAKFYVNPTEYVTINSPTTKANTGFEFGAWDKDATIPTVYKEDATITGSFNGLKDIIPKTKNDDSEKPKGYVTVTFEIEKLDGKEAGKIVDGETITYFVKPNTDVTIPQPKTLANTGYVFEKWNQDTTKAKKYTADTTVKGNFKKLGDIIPATEGKGTPNAKPEGYVTVTFDKGANGKSIEGKTVYYVNPKADPAKTLGDKLIVKPTVKAETGYKFTGWDTKDDFQIKDNKIVIAQYKEIDDVIPKNKPTGGENDKPESYITVTFEKGDHGELEGNTILYVNPNKAVVLKDKAPTIKPNTGYTSAGWDTTINKAIQYIDGDKITALYNELGDVIPQEKQDGSDKPAGYLTVTFVKGDYGELTGKKVYYVKPKTQVTVPAPTVKANVGYEFEKWDKGLTQTFTADNTNITAEYKELANIIPQEKTDSSDKPNGYVTVTFKSDANGSLTGKTVYYVNSKKTVDLTDTAKAINKNPNTGYTAEGGTWSPAITNKTYTENAEYTFNFVKLDDVIPEIKEGGNKNKKPEGYITVILIPTDKATDPTNKVFFVKPNVEVKIPSTDPVGKENKAKEKFIFKSWDATRGTITPSWKKPETGNTEIKGAFIQDTEITAQYSTNVVPEKLVPAPVAKKNVVTPKGDTPKPGDLIENKTGLPEGTTFNYTNDGTPDVNNPGKTTAKVEVKYPNGKTVVVEVPITVVDNVVPQIGNDKPLVPKTYVKVTVDTTDAATDNTKFVKVFWVKPNEKVKIPDILDPTGKKVVEDGVTKTNNFKKWKLVGSNPEKFYETEIEDTFAEKESTIVATYEQDKNVEPKGKNNQWIPQGSNPSPKDFIENPYNDDDPNNKDNLPPGTKFEFVKEPDTKTPGTDKKTTIKITYPNGETKEVPVKYNVTGDVVEQKEGEDKSNVPDNYVKVILIPTDKATDGKNKVYFVNPKAKNVTITNKPEGKKEKVNNIDQTYTFEGWKVTKGTIASWANENINGQFTQDTEITAQYSTKLDAEKLVPAPVAKKDVVTAKGDKPKPEDLIKNIPGSEKDPLPKGTEITYEKEPNVDNPGDSTAKVKIKYPNGKTVVVEVPITVVDNVVPQIGNDKPLVPESYVKVLVDTTDKAEENTRFVKTFWVKPNVEVTIPGILAPTGKTETINGVKKKNKFVKWQLEGTPTKTYDKEIKDKFTANVSKIIATYEFGKDETTPDQPGGQPGEVEKHGNRYIERVAGKDRVHTAINTSRRFFNKSRYVIIADSGNYPDALTATVLAHVLDAPILLNNTRYLEDDVAREIVRLGASEVIIVGGHKSISENVKSQLARYDQNSVQRIWGRDRYVTSSELAYEIQRLTGKVNKAIIASGENFPDALATAPLGSKEIAPILLVRRNQIDKKVDKALKDLNIKRVYVAGGQHSVSKELEEQLPQVIRRFNGRDRYETAILVASYTYPESKEVFVASGEVFPDALVIGPVCARRKAPILLSRTTPVKVTDDYIEKSNIEYLYIIGGTNTIYAETAHKYAIED